MAKAFADLVCWHVAHGNCPWHSILEQLRVKNMPAWEYMLCALIDKGSRHRMICQPPVRPTQRWRGVPPPQNTTRAQRPVQVAQCLQEIGCSCNLDVGGFVRKRNHLSSWRLHPDLVHTLGGLLRSTKSCNYGVLQFRRLPGCRPFFGQVWVLTFRGEGRPNCHSW